MRLFSVCWMYSHSTRIRVFKNGLAKEVISIEKRPGGARFEDVRHLVSGERGKQVYTNGDPEFGVWTAGQVVGIINDIPTCLVLVERIAKEAEDTIGSLSKQVQPKPRANL
jgi:NADH:quinone reductase (non-electrogenic)